MSAKTTTNDIIWRKGKLVILRPFTERDLPLFQKWINDPDTNMFLSTTWPQSYEAEKAWYEEVVKSNPDKLCLAICTHDGNLIGNISLNVDPRKRSAETGTVIGEEAYRGHGYGTDAKMLLLDYAFNWLDLRKVTSRIFSFNSRSQNYAKRCGYRHMATIEKEHFRHGEWRDEEIYVVFKEEWLPFWEEYQVNTSV